MAPSQKWLLAKVAGNKKRPPTDRGYQLEVAASPFFLCLRPSYLNKNNMSTFAAKDLIKDNLHDAAR